MNDKNYSPLERLRTSVTATILLWSLLATGCARRPEPEPAPAEPVAPVERTAGAETPRVALVMKALTNPFFQTMQAGAEAYAKEHGVDLTCVGIEKETDVEQQIQQVRSMIRKDVQAIVIAPADSKALVSVLKQAQDEGIHVVNIDNRLDAEAMAQKELTGVPFVGPDNFKGAKKAGDYLAAALKKRGGKGAKTFLIGGIKGVANADARWDGFQAAMKEAGLTITAENYADWDRTRAREQVDALLNEHPDVAGILCANDMMALGALAAVKQKGKVGQVLIVGYDNLEEMQEAIRAGEVLATVEQHPDKMGAMGVEYAVKLIRGEEAPAEVEVPTDLITKETLEAER